jgi:mRNA interferase RelE/StbE
MTKIERCWEILLGRQAEKVMRRLPRDLLQRLDQAILGLATNPRPSGCQKLVGHDNLFRVRVGHWRISYAIEDEQLIILIVEVAPRGEAYRF